MPGGEHEMRVGGWTGETEKRTTGRFLVLLGTNDPKEARTTLSRVVGISSLAAASDFSRGVIDPGELRRSFAGVFLDNLGVAAVSVEPEQQKRLGSARVEPGAPIIAVEPERYVYAAEPAATGSQWDESSVTWGLQAVKVPASRYGGRGATVAVLDTGIDSSHPDMGSRIHQNENFVLNQSLDDRNGHGTHCAGTACGPQKPRNPTRYGIAYNASLLVGKVLDDKGEGEELNVLAGISWAVRNGCNVVSLSLRAEMGPNEGYSTLFEGVAQRALDQGTVIVAAAGNDSSRPRKTAAVGHPACCPSVVAVAAIDQQLEVASFSNGSIGQGGQVDIAAPGVEVLSSWLSSDPIAYARSEGTSMAAPHVAGVLALLVEAYPEATAKELRDHLMGNARSLQGLGRADVGVGLVQAP
jgi:subtilisin